MAGFGGTCSRFILVGFNIIFWLSGIVLIIMGSIYAADQNFKEFQEFLSPDDPMLGKAMYVLIGIGCFVFVFGFCGCCGAMRESKCLLGVYIFILILVMVAELAIGIVVAVNKKEAEKAVEEKLINFIRTKYPPDDQNTNDGANAKKRIDHIQHKILLCCGIRGADDWLGSKWFKAKNVTGSTIYRTPRSCCTSETAQLDDKGYETCQVDDKLHNTGCWEKTMMWIQKKFPQVIGIGCGIAALQIIGLICAITLLCSIQQREKYES